MTDVLEEEGGLDPDTQESPVCPRSRDWSDAATATATVAWVTPPPKLEEARRRPLQVTRKRGPGPLDSDLWPPELEGHGFLWFQAARCGFSVRQPREMQESQSAPPPTPSPTAAFLLPPSPRR